MDHMFVYQKNAQEPKSCKKQLQGKQEKQYF